jgi:Tol biopolymer transport system component
VYAGLTKRLCLIVLVPAFALPTAGSAGLNVSRSGPPLLTYVASTGGICLIRANGSDPVRLTPRWKRVGDPQWSPRGRYLAFSRFVGYDTNHDPVTRISVADARGRIHWTFGDAPTNEDPRWSPDGRRILYYQVWAHSADYSVARANGSHIHELAGCAYNGPCPGQPSWRADGRRLAFDDHGTGGALSIFTVRPDGSDRRLLIANASQPVYAPRGSKLAYVGLVGSPDSPSASLFIADADGSHPHAITPPSRDVIDWLAWSPDARLLVFLRLPCLTTCSSMGDLVVIKAGGSGERTVAKQISAQGLLGVAWSPDRTLIAFLRAQSIVVARADGGGERVVVSRVGTWAGASLPAWRVGVPLPVVKRPPCPRR